MAVAGQKVNPELDESVVGVVFDQKPDGTPCGLLYIDEGAGTTELSLSRDELYALVRLCNTVASQIEWENAWWVYAKGPLSNDKYHLMRKGQHDEKGKPLCGRSVSSYYPHKWDLSPVINEPWRTNNFCKLCLASYDKAMKEV